MKSRSWRDQIKQYTWDPSYRRAKGDPEKIYHRLEELGFGKDGFSKRDVIEDAKSPGSVLHPFFTWNLKEAAYKYWLEEAGELCRSITITVVVVKNGKSKETSAPALVAVRSDHAAEGESQYRTYALGDALADPQTRRLLLEQALAGLQQWQTRYHILRELAPIIASQERHAKAIRRRLAKAGRAKRRN